MIDLGMWFTQITGILRTDAGNNFTSDTATWVDTCKDDDPCLTLIDTGTSYITMPSTEYDSLVTYLNSVVSSCVTDNSQFMCPESDVDKLPTLWFQLGGHALPLTPSEYFVDNSCSSGYTCLGISSTDSMGSHTYILGDTFLRSYYAVFDESEYKVGFGSLNDNMEKAISRPGSVCCYFLHILCFLVIFFLFFALSVVFFFVVLHASTLYIS